MGLCDVVCDVCELWCEFDVLVKIQGSTLLTGFALKNFGKLARAWKSGD